jgi:hypothetical protein
LFPLFATGVNNTSGTGGKICRWYPVANLPPVAFDTGGNFATDVIDTGGKFATGVVDTGGAPWLANISANFRKNWNALMLFSGAWGKVIHGKNLKQKLSWHCPFKCRYGAYQVMKKKFAKDKQAKQANLRQRMRELKKVFQIVCQIKPFKGTVRPDWICMRVVPLDWPWKEHQPLYLFDF